VHNPGISLAASKIAYSGIEAPLKRVTIMKHVFIGETFTDYHLMQIVLELEAALTLAMEISEVPPREQAKQVSP
jgi:hypothetical protein